MANRRNVQNFVINEIPSQEIYDYLAAHGLINQNELYLVAGDEQPAFNGISVNGSSPSPINQDTGIVNITVKEFPDSYKNKVDSVLFTLGQDDGGVYMIEL